MEFFAAREKSPVFPVPPSDIEIDDEDLVAALHQSLDQVVALMRPPLNPIGFLENEDAHACRAPQQGVAESLFS